MKPNKCTLVLALAGAVSLAPMARASLSTSSILNNGFELSYNVQGNGGGYPGPSYDGAPTDWHVGNVVGGGTIYGAWVPATDPSYTRFSGYVGNNVGLIAGTATLYQDIGTVSGNAGNYQLTLLVGDDFRSTSAGNPTIVVATGSAFGSLGANLLSSVSTPNLTVDNKMHTWTYDFNISATYTGDVWIELENGVSGASIDFDNLQITAVPEPVNVALGMFGGLAVMWWGLGLCWKKPEAVNAEME